MCCGGHARRAVGPRGPEQISRKEKNLCTRRISGILVALTTICVRANRYRRTTLRDRSMSRKGKTRAAGRYVGMIHRFARRYFAAEMDRLGLPATAFPLIWRLLRRDDVSQDELSGDFLVDKGTTARKVAKLEEAGLVERSVDPEDRRIKRVRVTDKARELAPDIRAVMREWNEKLLDGFSEEEKEQALALLERMAENARAHWEDVVEPRSRKRR